MDLSLIEEFEKEFHRIEKEMLDKQDIYDIEQLDSELVTKIREYEERNKPRNP